jgi:hypothetical protein
MNDLAIHDLAEAVQHNCHISDARHGADYSLCVYLMKMREYYRWEKGLPYGAALAKDHVGNWLQAREQLWEDLAQAELAPIAIEGEHFDPFDAEGINIRLEPHGLVYSGGLGNQGKPHFFLGDLEQRRRTGDYSVFVVAGEYARDLTAPPAMTLGQSIFLRRESLRRLLWEKLESWRWTRADNALGRAFACYDFEGALEQSLDAMTDREIDAVLLHEQGEYEAGERLGDGWNRMLLDLVYTPAELMARAVRDHLADCLVTLPALAAEGDESSLHFYMGNLTHMRKELFPMAQQAYEEWRSTNDCAPMVEAARAGRSHWEQLSRAMLDLHREAPPDLAREVQLLVADSHL